MRGDDVLTPTSELVSGARERGIGVAAFNGITLEHAEAIVVAAERMRAPVILALSHNAVRFHGSLRPVALAYRALAEDVNVPVGLHLDHVDDLALLEAAPGLGFGSVMYDGSGLPYDANVARTRRAADVLHAQGVWVESELGEIGGKDGAHAPQVRTDPDEAASYVAATGVDALAVAVGSSHAMTTRTAELDLGLVARLRDAVPVPLVLHGSSGVSDAGIAAAVLAGLVKINIGTQLNIAYTDAVTAGSAAGRPDPRPVLAAAREAMAATAERLIGVVTDPSGHAPAQTASGQTGACGAQS
jgi:fructose-bisphosphate aldolase, class II